MKRRRLPVWACAAAIFLWLSFPAQAADVSNEQIDALIKLESPLAAAHWNLVPLFQIIDGGLLEMSPSGTIRFGRDGMRAILKKAAPDRHQIIVRWVAAHETWHQVQRRDGNTVSREDVAARRQLECEADVMAAQYLAESVMTGEAGPELMKNARLLAASISSILDTLQEAEQGFGGAAAHPSGPQRRYEIALGLTRGILPLVEKTPDFEGRMTAKKQIHNLIDFRDSERAEDWSSRICHLNLNAGGYADALGALNPAIRYNKDGDPPIVEFSVPYKNIGSEPISISMQVRTIAVPRQSPENVDAWQSVDAINYEFDLSPGQQYTVSGTLLWVANEEFFPQLLLPKEIGTLYSVKILDADKGASDSTRLYTLTPRQLRLAGILQTLFNASADNFEDVKKQPCRLEGGDMSCAVTVSVPSAQSAEIIYEGAGGRYLDLVLYKGSKREDASRAFSDFKRDMERIFNATINERTTSSGGRSFHFKPQRNIKLEVLLFGDERPMVIARILPALF
ncbi:hypothetical protein [Janthinobacterium svalbardensis]|uniref:hypothetical protein n=1 Tax=Janthinobacterium svalbardensis TaxID=368607 RepID=UPI002FCD96AF